MGEENEGLPGPLAGLSETVGDDGHPLLGQDSDVGSAIGRVNAAMASLRWAMSMSVVRAASLVATLRSC